MRIDKEGNILRIGESQRKDGMYQYRWVDEKGTGRISLAEDLGTLRKEIQQIHRYLDYGIPTESMMMTLDQLYSVWLNEKRVFLKTRTLQRYTGMYENRISKMLGSCLIRDIRKTDIRRYCEYLVWNLGFQEQTVRNYFRLIYQILEFGVREGYLPENPAYRAYRSGRYENEKRNPKQRKALTLREQQILLKRMAGTESLKRWRPVIQFMLFTGLRIGEIQALRWEDIDLEGKLIFVQHTLGKKTVMKKTKTTGQNKEKSETAPSRRNHYQKCLTEPKSSSSKREIPMLKKTEEALREEMKHQDEWGVTCREKVDGYDDYVFLSDEGRLLTVTAVNQILRKACREVQQDMPDAFQGLEKVTCHTLRHTFATRLCEAGVQMKVIQDVMGHADIGMTMDLYAEATVEQMKSEIRLLGGKHHAAFSESSAGTHGTCKYPDHHEHLRGGDDLP